MGRTLDGAMRLGICAVALFAGSLGVAAAADPKVTIMVGGIEKQIYLPAKLAEQLGYFKEEGANVELLTEPAGVQAENTMLAGEVQGVVGFYDHTVDLQAKGKIVLSVVQFAKAPGEVELVDARKADTIKSPADFKGKTLGVTGLGSSTNFLTLYLAVKNGVAVADVHPLAVGSGNTFIAAMKQGQIDAGMTTEPTVSVMLNSGQAKILLDLRSPEKTREALGGDYPAASLYMPKPWVDAHKPEVQKIANALVRTMGYIATHSGAEIADKMPKDYYAGDKAVYAKALDEGKAMFTRDGRMPDGGPETVLKVLQAFDKTVQGKTIDLAQTYTTEFVDAAVKAGKSAPAPGN